MDIHAAVLNAHSLILHDLADAARALDAARTEAAAAADPSGPLAAARSAGMRLGWVNADASPLFHRWRDTGRAPEDRELDALAAAVQDVAAARSAATSALALQRMGRDAETLHRRTASDLRAATDALERIINGAGGARR